MNIISKYLLIGSGLLLFIAVALSLASGASLTLTSDLELSGDIDYNHIATEQYALYSNGYKIKCNDLIINGSLIQNNSEVRVNDIYINTNYHIVNGTSELKVKNNYAYINSSGVLNFNNAQTHNFDGIRIHDDGVLYQNNANIISASKDLTTLDGLYIEDNSRYYGGNGDSIFCSFRIKHRTSNIYLTNGTTYLDGKGSSNTAVIVAISVHGHIFPNTGTVEMNSTTCSYMFDRPNYANFYNLVFNNNYSYLKWSTSNIVIYVENNLTLTSIGSQKASNNAEIHVNNTLINNGGVFRNYNYGTPYNWVSNSHISHIIHNSGTTILPNGTNYINGNVSNYCIDINNNGFSVLGLGKVYIQSNSDISLYAKDEIKFLQINAGNLSIIGSVETENFTMDNNTIVTITGKLTTDTLTLYGNELNIGDLLGTSIVISNELPDSCFIKDTDLTISGYWELNSNWSYLQFGDLVVNGEMNFNSFRNNPSNLHIRTNSLTGNGELNISAKITYPATIEGIIGGRIINVSQFTDYYFNNVYFGNYTSTYHEYITVNGADKGTLIGNWDFDAPTINILYLTNNTNYYKGVHSPLNFSFYMEELSYIHSWSYSITRKSNDQLIESNSFNYSTPITNDYKIFFQNIDTYPNGDYWYNITVFDTHNKLYKDAKTKQTLFNSKIRIGKEKDSPKVGKYDLWENTGLSEILILEDFMKDKDIFTIEFLNTKDTNHLVKWLNSDMYYKLIHYLELKDNYVNIKLEGGDIKHIPNTYRFVINNTFYYDFSDFIKQDFNNNSVTISHKMKDLVTEYYLITLNNINWGKGDLIEIDPLSGSVNNAFQSFVITVNSTPPPIAKIEDITLLGRDAELTGGYDFIVNNTVMLYHWRSSIDGIFYNGTLKTFTALGFTPGYHTIYLKIMDDNNTWSAEVNQTILIGNLTIESGGLDDTSYLWFEDRSQFISVMGVTLGGIFILIMMVALFKKKW